MSVKKRVAINGFGRIGRALFRNYCIRRQQGEALPFEIVAVNDREDPEILRHLFRYDSAYGKADPYMLEQLLLLNFSQCVEVSEGVWQESDVDYVVECSGSYRHRDALCQHLEAGADKVLLAAPAFDCLDRMLVYGVNHHQLQRQDQLVSNASCTTNALAVTLHLLLTQFDIAQAWVTEIHGYTSDQNLLDHAHRDPRRARSAPDNMIPTQTMGLSMVERILPELEGAVIGYSMRVPLPVGACLDVTLRLKGEYSNCGRESINALFKAGKSRWLGYSNEPLVSSDFIGRAESAVFDATQTQVSGDMVKMLLWFDNEWGYSNRLLDVLDYWMTH